MPVHDPDAFVKALKALGEGEESPYHHILAARNQLTSATMPTMALGLAGAFFVGDEYEQSRKFFQENLEWGSNNFFFMLKALEKVGENHHATESANLIDPKDSDPPPPQGLSIGWADLSTGLQLIATAAAWGLAIRSMLVMTALRGAAKFSIAAIASTLLWAAFTPMDTALTEVHSKWESASAHLTKFNTELSSVLPQFARAWSDSEGSQTFDDFVTKLKEEIAEGQLLVQQGAATLQSIHDHLNFRQYMWLAFTLGILILMITLQAIGSAFPPSAGAMRTIVEFVGGMLSKTVSTWIALIGEVCKAVFFGVVPMELKNFVAEKKEWTHGGETHDGLDLQNVALSPDELDIIEEKA